MKRFDTYRETIVSRIDTYFEALEPRLELPWWTEELTQRFRSFSTQGKLLRGCLLIQAYELFNRNERILHAPIDAAAAIELFHSAILIQDDIMDCDPMRRGEIATHVRLAEGRDEHTGEALAICMSDCGLFTSYDLLAGMDVEPDVMRSVLSTYSFELTKLGLAQMEDVALAASDTMPKRSDIETVLIEKSGRYTFSLPLVLGTLIAGAPEHRGFLEAYGDKLGLVFQIKDDELSLYGTDTGKPTGGDIREGKKTLFWHTLMQRSSEEDRRTAASIYGNRDATEEDVAKVYEFLEAYDVREAVLSELDPIIDELRDLIEAQDLTATQKQPFIELLEWNLNRTR